MSSHPGRRFTRSSAALLMSFALYACSGTAELKLVGETLKESTPPMRERVASLKVQHLEATKSYNQLRIHTLATYDALQLSVCTALTQRTLALLHEAEAATLVDLQKMSDATMEKIAPAITESLAGLQGEIDRQRSLIEQSRIAGGGTQLTGQYADIVFATLVAERNRLRTTGIVNAVTAIQKAMEGARSDLDVYVERQKKSVMELGTQCVEDASIKTGLLAKLGNEAASPEQQYVIVDTYLKHVAAASTSIELYTETSNPFDNNGLLRVLTGGVLTGLTGGDPQPSDDGTPPGEAALRDSLKGAATNLFAPLKSAFKNFSKDEVMKDAYLADIEGLFGDAVEKVADEIRSKGGQAGEAAKSEADKEVGGNQGDGT